jgi:neuroblastoma-amplified sequence
VLLRFLGCSLVSECWDNNDILSEISEFRDDIVKSAKGVIDMIYSDVYPEINGYNKQRLSYIYGILSACHSYLKRTSEIELQYPEHVHTHKLEPFQYYKVLEEECKKVSFIDGLNYKNIAGLDNLNFEHFNEEVCKNIHASTVSALADMVQSLVSMYIDVLTKGLISRQGVYKHYVLGLLASLEGRNEARSNCTDYENLQAVLCEIELNYDSCKEYIKTLPSTDISYIIGRYYTLSFPCNLARSHPQEPSWKKPLTTLVTFWTKLVDDMPRELTNGTSYESTEYLDLNRLSHCMRAFRELLINNDIPIHQGWDVISMYLKFSRSSGLMMDTSYFCRAMILSGCAFECVVEVYHEGQGQLGNETADPINPLDLLELYNTATDECLLDLIEGSCEHPLYLNKLLSSLSRSTEKHAGILEMVRSGVWGKLIGFSENMQLESQLRVYALQLMQCITGRNLKNLPNEPVSQVEPWESWYEHGTSAPMADESTHSSSGITGNLVALRSTQVVASVLPDANITPENLATLDSAVSCFLRLSEHASSVESIAVFEAVLEEWEQLFALTEEYVPPQESPKERSDWSDGWDDGWDELESPKKKQDAALLSVHPLHSCWMEIIRKLVGLHEVQKVIELLDRASSNHCVLLEEDEAQRLLGLVSASDCFIALKIVLLLPYETSRLKCLQMIEAKMREGTVSTSSNAGDQELLALVLSSGTIQKIIAEEAYSQFFSYVCHLVGHLARSFQTDLLVTWNDKSSTPKASCTNESQLFARLLFPCFICELVLKGQYLLAGFIISKWMHTHLSLGLMDTLEISVRHFLEAQFVIVRQLGGDEASFTDNVLSARHAISSLHLRLVSLLQAALAALPKQEL